jgi:hypothetical protein
MNIPDDCGKTEGDNKLEQGSGVTCTSGSLSNTLTGCVNRWTFAGMAGPAGSGPSASLACPGVWPGHRPNGLQREPARVRVHEADHLADHEVAGPRHHRREGSSHEWGPPVSITGINPGDTVVVSGYDGSLGNNVVWNIYNATNTTLIAQSSFHLSCSDVDMNTSDDCGKTEGDNKLEQGSRVTCTPVDATLSNTSTGCVNRWTFEGMAGPAGSAANASLDYANPNGSAPVTYNYVVTNNTSTAVSGVHVTDTVTDSNGTQTVDICTQDLAASGTFTCSAVDNIGLNTTNIAHASAAACPTPADSNQVTVTVGGGAAGACPTAETTLTVKDKDVSWKIKATGGELGRDQQDRGHVPAGDQRRPPGGASGRAEDRQRQLRLAGDYHDVQRHGEGPHDRQGQDGDVEAPLRE